MSASLLLSTAYFVAAIGVWLVQSGQKNISADITAGNGVACTPASQATETFDGLSANSTLTSANRGWTEQLIPGGTPQNQTPGTQFIPGGPTVTGDVLPSGLMMKSPWRISHPIRESKNGSVAFDLTGGSPYPIDVTLNNVAGPLMQFRVVSSGPGRVVYEAFDAFTSSFVALSLPPLSPNGYSRIELRWTESGFDVFVNNQKLNPAPLGYQNGSTRPPATLVITLPNFTVPPNTGQSQTDLTQSVVIFKAISFPTGEAVACVTGIDPQQGPIKTVVTLTGSQFETAGMKVTMKPVMGDPLTIDQVTFVDATHIKFTVPDAAKVGPYQVGITNSFGPSKQTQGLTVTPVTVTPVVVPTSSVNGVALVCPATDPGKPVTDDFEAFADGQTKEFGWGSTAPSGTAATIRKDVGKVGNALELTDANATVGAAGAVVVSRSMKAADKGTLSFDVLPKQTTGRLVATLAGAKGGQFILSLAPDGTIQAWDDRVPTPIITSKFVRIGTATYKANEYANLKLDWSTLGVDVTLNGLKINDKPLPYSFGANVAPVTTLLMNTGSEELTGVTGSYLIDTVTFPGCASGLSLTVSPTSGVAPLAVTATATVPAKNLLNEPFTELNDTGAPADQHVSSSQKVDTGVLELTNVPAATVCDAKKSWPYDLDTARLNQLQWKQAIPNQATIDAKISWATPTTVAKSGVFTGGIGLIDSQGFLHNYLFYAAPYNSSKSFGSLFSELRSYSVDAPVCFGTKSDPIVGDSRNLTDDPESTAIAGTPIKGLAAKAGSSQLRIVRRGAHGQSFIDGQLMSEADLKGDVAGVALAAATMPTFPFGTIRLETLTLTNNFLSWNFGDGSAKVTGTDTTVQHSYTQAGEFLVSVTNGSEVASQGLTVTVKVVVTPPTSTVPVITVDTGSSPAPTLAAQAASTAKLIASGGSLVVNLALATLLAVGTTYGLLRRRGERRE